MKELSQVKSLQDLLTTSGGLIDPVEAALLIALEDKPDFEMDWCREQLALLAEKAKENINLEKDANHCAQSLCFLLGEQEGFHGDKEDFFNPDNSYLDRVLRNKKGIPISLALVYLAAARQLDLKMDGISFPGHFLVSLRHQGLRVVIDPFENRVITPEECRKRLSPAHISSSDLEQLLQPTQTIDFIVRLLTNLLQNYVNLEDFGLALRCQERIALLAPNSPTRHMELARIYRHMGRSEAAIRALEPLFDHPDRNLREFIEGAVQMLEKDEHYTVH